MRAKSWPEFAQQGKDRITIRQLLGHQAGLYALDVHVDQGTEADLDKLAIIIAPAEAGLGAGYAAGLPCYHARVL